MHGCVHSNKIASILVSTVLMCCVMLYCETEHCTQQTQLYSPYVSLSTQTNLINSQEAWACAGILVRHHSRTPIVHVVELNIRWISCH